MDKAIQAYANRDEQSAMKFAEAAVECAPNFAEAYYLMSDIYGTWKDSENRLACLQKGTKFQPTTLGYLNLAKTELSLGKYAEASESARKASELDVAKSYAERLNDIYTKAEFGKKSVANPVDFHPVNIGKSVNSEFDDYLPSLSLDETQLIFTRAVKRSEVEIINDHNDTQEDFYLSEKQADGTWSAAKPFGNTVNTKYNEGAQSISPDGKILFFTSCQNAGTDSPHGKSYGSCDIFYSVKTSIGWGRPVNAGTNVNTRYWESQPCFSGDGRTLYFISNRPGGEGESDIWTCKLNPDGTWTKAENLGKKINSSGKEQSPFIHPDNQTLYFATDGHIGLGQSDLFVARRDVKGAWQTPENLGFPINTHNEEFALIINATGDKAYYAADVKDGYGRLDLLSFDLPQKLRPVPTTYIKGLVYDAETREELFAHFQLIDIQTDSLATDSYSGREDGTFMLSLPTGKNYALNVEKEGYLFYSESFSIKDTATALDFFEIEVPLQPIRKGHKIVLNNIFFDTDKHELRPESVTELNKLLNFLQKNPTLKVEIGGHTDNVGSVKHNMTLSENRAKSVVEYLVNQGIDSKRLTYKGYGSSVPIAENNSAENRQKNRRTECKIME